MGLWGKAERKVSKLGMQNAVRVKDSHRTSQTVLIIIVVVSLNHFLFRPHIVKIKLVHWRKSTNAGIKIYMHIHVCICVSIYQSRYTFV